MNRWLSKTSAGEYLDVSTKTIDRMVKESRLQAFYLPNGRRRFRQANLDEVIRKNNYDRLKKAS